MNWKIKGLPLLATLFLAGRLLEEISKALDGYAGGDGVLLLLRDILSGVMVWVMAGGILLGALGAAFLLQGGLMVTDMICMALAGWLLLRKPRAAEE